MNGVQHSRGSSRIPSVTRPSPGRHRPGCFTRPTSCTSSVDAWTAADTALAGGRTVFSFAEGPPLATRSAIKRCRKREPVSFLSPLVHALCLQSDRYYGARATGNTFLDLPCLPLPSLSSLSSRANPRIPRRSIHFVHWLARASSLRHATLRIYTRVCVRVSRSFRSEPKVVVRNGPLRNVPLESSSTVAQLSRRCRDARACTLVRRRRDTNDRWPYRRASSVDRPRLRSVEVEGVARTKRTARS